MTIEDLHRATNSYRPCAKPDCEACAMSRVVMARLEADAQALADVRTLDEWAETKRLLDNLVRNVQNDRNEDQFRDAAIALALHWEREADQGAPRDLSAEWSDDQWQCEPSTSQPSKGSE